MNYTFLNDIGTLPKMVTEAMKYLGTKEIPGKQSNPVILNMAKELGIGDIYTNDDTAWCALFISYICKKVGKPIPFAGYHFLRAASFSKWGKAVGRGNAMLGDILVFTRQGGGHVGLYIAETEKTFIVLGGNQGNAVSFTEIAKDRLSDVRRYYSIAPPVSAKKYYVNSSGVVSKNEA
ncbi:MAG TPA: TIGR02594 family protein [Agriterribacter sp.]|uniref:TIGR02594 family protein n=1 Tax=Agriterribacter sp. TaxID=2821509 RepID=UPI002CB18CFE|nr:TIGR02594 family protein [Agriterribacter sp.]HRQ17687.1 TIGR02594 family protein [Agriterribacter sp.]